MPGKSIEAAIMSQQIPYCNLCREKRDTELASAGLKKPSTTRGKGRADAWASESESEEEDEWGGG